MRSNVTSTMFVVLLVLVSVVSGNVNFTNSAGGSRMAWMKALFDHHGWLDAINDGNVTLQEQCSDHMKKYLEALHDGKLWASKSKLKHYLS